MSGRRDDGGKTGGKKGTNGSKPGWYGDKVKGSSWNRGKGKSEVKYFYDCGEQRHIGVNCPRNWTNSTDEKDDQSHRGKVSLRERGQKNSRASKHLATRVSGASPSGTES